VTSNEPLMLRRLLRAKDRIDGAPEEEWPVSRLGRVSGVSEAHFARSFKQAFGIPPHRYLVTRRVERAKALLRDTDMPITEIAYAVGWNSLGTFSRTYRDVTGHSPSRSRREQKDIVHAFEHVPHCFVSAAHRPDLRIAVSEKRRIDARSTQATQSEEVS
jgi:transcriptional regulator GlxA family with amidase domain